MITKYNKINAIAIALICTVLIIACGCKNNPHKVDIEDIKVNVSFERFDRDLLAADTAKMDSALVVLEKKYPTFFSSFYSEIIELKGLGTPLAPNNLKEFMTFAPTVDLNKRVQQNFSDVSKYNQEITTAYKYYKYHFPQHPLPNIIYFTGIINYACIYNETDIAIGLDMYLGNNYPYLQIPYLNNYQIVRMRPEYITRNVMNALVNYRFAKFEKGKRFLDKMIHEGKLAYFLDATLPDVSDSIKLALTTKQLQWCEKSEWQMWQHFVDPKLSVLYTTSTELINRYFEDGPFTNANNVPPDSSPRFAVWTGRQIIRKYMKNNPAITLEELMMETDSDKILKESKYKPK